LGTHKKIHIMTPEQFMGVLRRHAGGD
jgi:hypothetical protein